nr:MAG TPA: hypothetical protein [Caudoviricetes sp.]
MNKKDVLGARSAAGNVQKMESMPHSIQCRKCSKYDTQHGKGKAGFWLYCYYLIKYQQVQIIVKEF